VNLTRTDRPSNCSLQSSLLAVMDQSTGQHGPLFEGGTSRWLKFLLSAYDEPHRHYHNRKHIQSMLGNLDDISMTLPLTSQQLRLLQVAVWFHDVIYIVPSEYGRNECLSALQARKYCLDSRESGGQFKWVWVLSLDDAYYCLTRKSLLLNI
jgi:predicted metal-dependent HD superfamily phosphohydrolase